MPLPLTVSCFSKILVLPFWYQLTRVVPDKGPLNTCALLTYMVVRPCESETPLLALLALYLSVRPSVRPSVRLSVYPPVSPSNPPHAADAGLLLWARLTGDIGRLLHGRQTGGQQQPRRRMARSRKCGQCHVVS